MPAMQLALSFFRSACLMLSWVQSHGHASDLLPGIVLCFHGMHSACPARLPWHGMHYARAVPLPWHAFVLPCCLSVRAISVGVVHI